MNLSFIDFANSIHIKLSDLIASIGVLILLIAFVLNLNKKLDANTRAYTAMNFIGAAMCGLSSYMIKFYPFVLLEGVWCTFALISFIKVPRGKSK